MYRKPFILLFLIWAYLSVGQTVINSSGFSALLLGNTYEFSLGEIAIHTLNAPSVQITQGMLQPLPMLVGTQFKEVKASFSLTLYPNPLQDKLNIRFEKAMNNDIEIFCFNPLGKLVDQFQIRNIAAGQTIQCKTSLWIPGMYRVVLQTLEENSNSMITRHFNLHKF